MGLLTAFRIHRHPFLQTVIVYPVYLLGVEHFDLLNEFVEHPRRQLAGAGVFADQGDEHRVSIAIAIASTANEYPLADF